MSPFKLSASEGPQSNRGFHHICERKERDGLTVDRRPGNLTSEMAILPRAESFMRTRTRGSPSWPERTLRGRIHYCRLIETNSQKSTCRSGAGHTFGSDSAVLLVYGEQDWAPPVERERTRSLIPSVAICHNHCIEDDDEKAAQHQSCASVLRSPAHWHLRRRRPRSGSCPPTARDRSPPRIDNPGFAARGRRPRRGPGAARSPAAARSRHPR